MSSVHEDIVELLSVSRHKDRKRLVRRIKRQTATLRKLFSHLEKHHSSNYHPHKVYIQYFLDDVSNLHTNNTLKEYHMAAKQLHTDLSALHNVVNSFMRQNTDLHLKSLAIRVCAVPYFKT